VDKPYNHAAGITDDCLYSTQPHKETGHMLPETGLDGFTHSAERSIVDTTCGCIDRYYIYWRLNTSDDHINQHLHQRLCATTHTNYAPELVAVPQYHRATECLHCHITIRVDPCDPIGCRSHPANKNTLHRGIQIKRCHNTARRYNSKEFPQHILASP
jgi:hypothetical protein